jgi:3-isopropylmalate dehydrogenase
MLTGSLGMLPSASLGAEIGGKRAALYEPVHGSAPDIAGQKASPTPSPRFSQSGMMLRYSFGLMREADLIDQAINTVLGKGLRTADIMQDGAEKISTTAMGDAILAELHTLSTTAKVA